MAIGLSLQLNVLAGYPWNCEKPGAPRPPGLLTLWNLDVIGR